MLALPKWIKGKSKTPKTMPPRSCGCTRILKFEGDTTILSKTTNSSRKLKPFPRAKKFVRLKHHNPDRTTTSATWPVRALQNVHISCLSQCPEVQNVAPFQIFWWKYPNKQAPMLNYPPLFIVRSWLLTLDTSCHSLAALSFSLPSGAVLLGNQGLGAGGVVKTSTNGGHWETSHLDSALPLSPAPRTDLWLLALGLRSRRLGRPQRCPAWYKHHTGPPSCGFQKRC